MTPFLDFILINVRTAQASDDYMLYNSMTITEATAALYRTVNVTILRFLRLKG
jgi:hypothetical protein